MVLTVVYQIREPARLPCGQKLTDHDTLPIHNSHFLYYPKNKININTE